MICEQKMSQANVGPKPTLSSYAPRLDWISQSGPCVSCRTRCYKLTERPVLL